jgi:hypothetical protein
LSQPRADVAADENGKVKLVGTEKFVKDLLKADITELQSALSPAEPKKPALKRARVLAVVIGLNAEATGDKGEAAAIREQAGKVVDAIANEKLAEAKEAAKALTTAKEATGAKPVDLIKVGLFDSDPTTNDWDRDLTMQLFKTPRAGGLGIETNVKKWSGKAPVGKDVDVAAQQAQKAAIIGMTLQRMSAPKDKKEKGSEWKKLAEDMQKASEDALVAADKKDGKAMVDAFSRLDKACTVCHEKFK